MPGSGGAPSSGYFDVPVGWALEAQLPAIAPPLGLLSSRKAASDVNNWTMTDSEQVPWLVCQK